ncbi:unnamed protein product, partial [Gulo gulo]
AHRYAHLVEARSGGRCRGHQARSEGRHEGFGQALAGWPGGEGHAAFWMRCRVHKDVMRSCPGADEQSLGCGVGQEDATQVCAAEVPVGGDGESEGRWWAWEVGPWTA